MSRILIVDDDLQIRRMLRASLEDNGYEVGLASNGAEGLAEFEKQSPALVISDLAMPVMDGLAFTRTLRSRTATPIIVLSVRDTEEMKISALDDGANDYLTKPFSMPELLARVRVQLRKAPIIVDLDTSIEQGDFSIDLEAHQVRVRGEALHLTPKEFDLLVAFARTPGKLLTHRVLLRTVWGTGVGHPPEYLRVLIASLRKKLEPTEGPKYILNEPGVGYRFEPEATSALTRS